MSKNSQRKLHDDIVEIDQKAKKRGYLISASDIFALGYMCAKYGVERLIDNQDKVIEACRKYDEKDDLGLLDTIGETLIDLEVISNEDGIL